MDSYYSSVIDGTMKLGDRNEVIQSNLSHFLQGIDIDASRTTLVELRYEGDNYRRYHTVDERHAGEGIVRVSSIVSDSLFTRSRGHALFLPLADCIGMTLFDKQKKILGMAHLGRHNLVQYGGTKNIEYMQKTFGSHPRHIEISLSAAAGKSAYPLHDINNKGLHEVALEQLLLTGVLQKNITVDTRDTTRDDRFFSHSNFLAGNQEFDGRHALVAIMR